MLPKCVHCVYGNQIWISGPQLEFVMQALADAPVGCRGRVESPFTEAELRADPSGRRPVHQHRGPTLRRLIQVDAGDVEDLGFEPGVE